MVTAFLGKLRLVILILSSPLLHLIIFDSWLGHMYPPLRHLSDGVIPYHKDKYDLFFILIELPVFTGSIR